ncbi:hypothetical protein RFI_06225 [Reticulomyxa filosa]|uniref:HTH OST-type domain-containing protein n=1 Tax=Reticulomyxa filosa TaxID=46433 RepID=X6NY64_RETFI|nr:hypothetical protein RFI_06225 [Reticulomyxa filosa]|eukprot:ETO30896.1 hypothetical protein RFI_06225 [Reticulomyxa filosa]
MKILEGHHVSPRARNGRKLQRVFRAQGTTWNKAMSSLPSVQVRNSQTQLQTTALTPTQRQLSNLSESKSAENDRKTISNRPGMYGRANLFCTHTSASTCVVSIFKPYFMRIFGERKEKSWYMKVSGDRRYAELKLHLVNDCQHMLSTEVKKWDQNNKSMEWIDRSKLPTSNQVLDVVYNESKDDISAIANHSHPYYIPVMITSVSSKGIGDARFALESLIIELMPLTERDKILCITSDFPQGIKFSLLKNYYFSLYHEHLDEVIASHFFPSSRSVHDSDPSKPSLPPLLSPHHYFDYFTLHFLDDLLCKRIDATIGKPLEDFLLLPNLSQGITVDCSVWIQNIIVNSYKNNSWFGQILGNASRVGGKSPSDEPLIEYKVIPPNVVTFNGKLSHLDLLMNYVDWLDQVEQCQHKAKEVDLSSSNVHDLEWNVFTSGALSLDETRAKPILFGEPLQSSTVDRYKITEKLLKRAIANSYFCNFTDANILSTMTRVSTDHTDNQSFDVEMWHVKKWLNPSIYLSHPFHCPDGISLPEFLQKFDATNLNLIIPRPIQCIIAHKFSLLTSTSPPLLLSSTSKKSMPTKTERINETSFATYTAKSILEAEDMAMTTQFSKSKKRQQQEHFWKNIVDLLIYCQDNPQWLNARIHWKYPPILQHGTLAIPEADLENLYLSYAETSLPFSHKLCMKMIIEDWYPFLEVQFKSQSLASGDNASADKMGGNWLRFLSYRSEDKINSIPHHETDVKKITSQIVQMICDFYPNGLHLSQIQPKLIQHFGTWIDAPKMIDQNTNLFQMILLHCKQDLSVTFADPDYDPIVVKRRHFNELKEMMFQELDRLDQRNGQGVPLFAIVAFVRNAMPGFLERFHFEEATHKQKKDSKLSKKKALATMDELESETNDALDSLLSREVQTALEIMNTMPQIDVNLTNQWNIRLFVSPHLQELYASVAAIVHEMTYGHTWQQPSILNIRSKICAKFPMVKPSKYGYATLEALIASTPHFSLYAPYPLNLELLLPQSYVDTCNAIEQAMLSVPNQKMTKKELKDILVSKLSPDSMTQSDISEIKKYLDNMHNHFSHILTFQWNKDQKTWNYSLRPKLSHSPADRIPAMTKLRFVFGSLHTPNTPSSDIRFTYSELANGWESKFGGQSKMPLEILLTNPCLVISSNSKNRLNTLYQWEEVKKPMISFWYYLSERVKEKQNLLDLNQFQDEFETLFGAPCLTLDMQKFLQGHGCDIVAKDNKLYVKTPTMLDFDITIPPKFVSNSLALSDQLMQQLQTYFNVDKTIIFTLYRNVANLSLRVFTMDRQMENKIERDVMEWSEQHLQTKVEKVNSSRNDYFLQIISCVLNNAQMSKCNAFNLHKMFISGSNGMEMLPNHCTKVDTYGFKWKTGPNFELSKTQTWDEKLISMLKQSNTIGLTFEAIRTRWPIGLLDSVAFPYSTHGNDADFCAAILSTVTLSRAIDVQYRDGIRYYISNEKSVYNDQYYSSLEMWLEHLIQKCPDGIALSSLQHHLLQYDPNLSNLLTRSKHIRHHNASKNYNNYLLMLDWLQHRIQPYIQLDPSSNATTFPDLFVTWKNINQLSAYNLTHHGIMKYFYWRERLLNEAIVRQLCYSNDISSTSDASPTAFVLLKSFHCYSPQSLQYLHHACFIEQFDTFLIPTKYRNNLANALDFLESNVCIKLKSPMHSVPTATSVHPIHSPLPVRRSIEAVLDRCANERHFWTKDNLRMVPLCIVPSMLHQQFGDLFFQHFQQSSLPLDLLFEWFSFSVIHDSVPFVQLEPAVI